MTSTRKPPHNRVDPRQRQAELYSGQQAGDEKPTQVSGVTLATMKWGYEGQPVRYVNGRLMVGDTVMRVRKGMALVGAVP